MVATTSTATTTPPTIPSGGRNATCPRTSPTPSSTRQATRASRLQRSHSVCATSPQRASAMDDITAAEMQHLVESLGAIGEQPGGGIIRQVYSEAWVAAARQLTLWMQEAGLDVRQDAVGNLFARIEG